MSRKPRPEKPEPTKCERCESLELLLKLAMQGIIPTPEPLVCFTQPEKLKPGHKWQVGNATVTVTSAANDGVVVNVLLDVGQTWIIPSAFHIDDLKAMYDVEGIPVLWEPKVITGEMEMTALNVPLGLTVGTVSSTLREVLAGEGALPGERYRVTFEQLPGVE